MARKKKIDYYLVGSIAAIIGFLISWGGLLMLNYWTSDYHELYWPLTMQIFGLIMMVTGTFIVIIGLLKGE